VRTYKFLDFRIPLEAVIFRKIAEECEYLEALQWGTEMKCTHDDKTDLSLGKGSSWQD